VSTSRLFRVLALLGAGVAAVLVAGGAAAATTGDRTLAPATRFFVPPPQQAAVQQALDLLRHRDFADAALLARMEATPRAVWLTSGTPSQVRRDVQTTMFEAALERAVPVLVAYDVPFRDCGQFSAGGARDTASYLQWIDGVARGIGSAKAVVILEPDGLGLVPGEGCTPSASDLAAAGLTLAQANQARYDQLNGAVDRLEQLPNVSVYLDATHPGWLNTGDAAQRLLKAGVQRAQGFFLNASNFQYTQNAAFYGTWVSDCITYATVVAPGDFGGCPNQYWDGGPATNWDGDALSTYSIWSTSAPYSGNHADLTWNTVGIESRWALVLGANAPTTHFVVDTSRNGQGPWQFRPTYGDAGTAQDWCNPPGRGLGVRPTANTGVPLVDAYLWIKSPGESDGSCNRGSGTTDPLWGGIVDPAAGAWFPQQALQLAQMASPALGS
jgi:endoglucanase